MPINNSLMLIVGKSASGKSASLRNLKNPKGVVFLNCESGKRLPFANKFRVLTVTDPLQVYSAFVKAEERSTLARNKNYPLYARPSRQYFR